MNSKAKLPQAQNPLILRCQRLMEAFAKSDDERNFYLDRIEGFILYLDLDKGEEEIEALNAEFKEDPERFVPVPKLSFYETKKIMEGFVNEKVYDIDTKEKLLDIISGKEARDHFLEFIYDHHSELEKWQQYYQERSRIRIIEWLRNHQFDFVFEEDLEISKSMIEQLKQNLFETKVSKEIQSERKMLALKAKTYYSNEALHPRPKRGRPPKQSLKAEVETEVSLDIYTQVSKAMRPFLFTPEIVGVAGATFSSRFETEEELLTFRRQQLAEELEVEDINQKLASLRKLSQTWVDPDAPKEPVKKKAATKKA